MQREHIHFVTGRLAEQALRGVLERLAPEVGFDYTVGVLNITVAALMTPAWIARRIHVEANVTRVLIPGYCHGDLAPISAAAGRPVDRGPKDLRELPRFFGRDKTLEGYGGHNIQILAEINHAPRISRQELLGQAAALRKDGADIIDVGCDPGDAWTGVSDAVSALRDAGHRVSIDSLNPLEIEAAVKSGAELVLSVNSTNREYAPDWGAEVVVIPDEPGSLHGLDESIEHLSQKGVRLRIDPVLEPIGVGFARSLARYLEVRRTYPKHEMLMGIGNLTELTDSDSAAVNVLLLGFCQELEIRSVLTTQVVNWARSAVRECDLARRLVYHAVTQGCLPKHVEPRLVMLRDEEVIEQGGAELDRLASQIRDPNYRIFADGGKLHVVSAGMHLSGEDPIALFKQLSSSPAGKLDLEHAFYLGYEMSKAVTALTLSKNYRQDQALDWGFLTVAEPGRGHGVAAVPPVEDR